ncbi:MAG: hypothetical protein OEM01_15585 [Desulfobulbaceae bacterium]|nr:hypothetical protein [Desulfobulbaceae bacterium]
MAGCNGKERPPNRSMTLNCEGRVGLVAVSYLITAPRGAAWKLSSAPDIALTSPTANLNVARRAGITIISVTGSSQM